MADSGHPNGATPQEIWSILREVAASQRETDRRLQETAQGLRETDQLLKRLGQETDRRLRKLDDLFNGQWGKLMEALVEGDLVELLNQRGIAVRTTSTNRKQDFRGRLWEIDIIAVNDGEVVAVEVKTTLKVGHVDHFLETLHHFTRLAPEYREWPVYGAVAYLKEDESSATYAARQGLFVIRATGSSASIVNRADFTPRSFGR